MKLEVQDYKPEEIQVKIANKMVIIEAKQETTHSSRSFYKKFSIPDGVKPENITSSLSPSGVLTISAPIEQINTNTATANLSSTQQQQSAQQSTQSISQSTQSVQKQQQQQQNVQQQLHSDSLSSLGSISSPPPSRFLDRDFILRPILDFNFDSSSLLAKESTNFEDISKQICQVSDGKKFEVCYINFVMCQIF
jgi:outer membrane protein OmpA-like peptidoglycan-associated protein